MTMVSRLHVKKIEHTLFRGENQWEKNNGKNNAKQNKIIEHKRINSKNINLSFMKNLCF